jgi:hypothetical protein
MMCRVALIVVCGLALAPPSLADVPGQPQARWKVLSYGITREHHPANRIYYARTPDQTAPWIRRISGRDQNALEHLNFSRYGVVAVFLEPRIQFAVYAVLLAKDGLSAQIRPVFLVGVAVPRYALIRIRKGSLPAPVKRLFIGEPG